MKKIFILLFTIITATSNLFAQDKLTIESFVEKSNDISGRTYSKTDNNGIPCALLKVHIASKNVKFEGLIIGDPEYKTSEYWVYMPNGSKRLTIKLEGYLPLDVEFSKYGIHSLESKVTYELVISGIIKNIIEEEEKIIQGWVLINSNPPGADVWFDGNHCGTTPLEKKWPYGTYSYELKKSKYHNFKETITLDKQKFEKEITLLPKFGRIEVNNDISGAEVILDNKSTKKLTPCVLDSIDSGEHEITIKKDKYNPISKKIIVTDNETTQVSSMMEARFAKITIKTTEGAQIFIDSKNKGTTTYSEELVEGFYDIEIKLEHHKPINKQIKITAGQPQEIELLPTPIYGSIDIKSTPNKANIKIDGKVYNDVTPTTIDKLLEGTHTIEITKEGYSIEVKTIDIKEGENAPLEINLKNTTEVYVICVPETAPIYLDGNYIGKGSGKYNLPLGKHTITSSADGCKDFKEDFYITSSTSRINVNLEKNFVTVYISCSPETAPIYLDGNYIGKGSGKYSLPLGKHTITSSADGCKDFKEDFNITSSTSRINVNLEKNFVKVYISCSPESAKLKLNGSHLGKGSGKYNLPLGRHTITSSADGYKDFKEDFYITSSTSRINVNLEKNFVTVYISCSPESAKLKLNGSHLGNGSGKYDLPLGKHTITSSADGYKDFKEDFYITSSTNINVNLKKRWLLERQEGFQSNYFDYTAIVGEEDAGLGLMYTHIKSRIGFYCLLGTNLDIDNATVLGGAAFRLKSNHDATDKYKSHWLLYGGGGYFDYAPCLHVGISHSFGPGMHVHLGQIINSNGQGGVVIGLSWGYALLGGGALLLGY